MIASALRRVLRPVEPRGRSEIERDVGDELSFHVETLERDLREQGLNAGEARVESTRRFGDIAVIKRRCVAAATWERTMLQKINLVILLAIGGLLAWAVLVQQRQIASAAQLVAAMREQSDAARARAEAEGARRGAVPVKTATGARPDSREGPGEQHVIYMEGLVGRPGIYTAQPGLTLRRALAASGGLTKGFRRALVINTDASGASTVRFTLTAEEFRDSAAGPDIELRANDLVRVE